MRGNIPDASHVQLVELIARDRIGNESVTRLQVLARSDGDGQRRVLARFSVPAELLGSAFLFVERVTDNSIVLGSPELEQLKQVTGEAVLGNLAGSDLTYEDIERLRAFHMRRKGSPSRDRPLGLSEGAPIRGLGNLPGAAHGAL